MCSDRQWFDKVGKRVGSALASQSIYACVYVYVYSIHLIPFLWSNAGIMDAGCSDMRATNSWSTSWIFSSCREKKAKFNRWMEEGERSPLGWKNRRLIGQRERCRGWRREGRGLRRSRWYFRARIDIIVTGEWNSVQFTVAPFFMLLRRQGWLTLLLLRRP